MQLYNYVAALDDGLDCLDDEEFGEENNYDALNDETFGSEATAGDWEQDHEKLAEITESSRRHRIETSKSESEIDVESSLSHLVLDEKEVTIPRPGVWDSPTFPIPPPQIRPKPLTTALKNACTVEELERGLITSRPPPGLIKPPISQPPPASTSGGNLFLNSITAAEKVQPINGVAPHPNQFPPHILPQNVRLLHPQFIQSLQNVGPLPRNLFRYPLPHPLLMPPGSGQRQPLHSNFPLNNFPHPPNSVMGPLPYMRPDHPLNTPFANNHQSMPQHNMHMGNQRNQNKQFNHNERQDNFHQPFFRNNQYHYQNQNHLNRYHGNQGHHGHMNHQHNHNHMGSNGIGPYGEHDEYAGLMNNREKQWLNNIQLLQLNTNQPYIDDYYYTVFCDRLNKKNEIQNRNKILNNKKTVNGKVIGNNNNNNNRDSRDREQPQHTFTKATNTPMQFENSLGKLQYSSVTAPRKIIDMDVVPNSDPQQTPSLQQKDTKKTRQLLLEIERLYILLLKLEDKKNPLAIIAEQQREQQQREQQLQQQQQEGSEPVAEPEPKDPVKEREDLILSIITPLLQFVQEDKFASLLSIRKGKTLFLRFLPCIDIKEHAYELAKLWAGIIKGLAIIGRRDSQLLNNFYTEFHKWVEENCTSVPLLMNLVQQFVDSINQPSKSNSLTFALTNKFGVSVIALMLIYAELSSDEIARHKTYAEQWSKFLRVIGESLSSPVVAPYELIESETLRAHLRRHEAESHAAAFEMYFSEANPTR